MRVLYLSYYFPPIGGAGVQRAVKFVRYLPEFGHQPVVVTGPSDTTGRWAPRDAALSADIGSHVEIVRAEGPEPPAGDLWRGRRERWLGLESRWDQWWSRAVLDAGRRARGRVDIIFCSMSPFTTAAPAARLSRELGVPWVADLRDPWALDEMTEYPTGLHRRIAARTMRRSLGSAAAIVMNTATATELLVSSFPELAAIPVTTIPNGFDAADFAGASPTRKTDGTVRIVHTGYLHTELGLAQRGRGLGRSVLGGSIGGVDVLTRSHVFLLEALAQLEDSGLSVELHLAGVLSAADRDAIPARAPVVLHGYVPHEASLELVRSADVLFLPMHDLPPGVRATIVPGKTYEYLASGRPILAAVPDGDARDLLASAAGVELTRPGDASAMAEAIVRIAAGGAVEHDRRALLETFERRELTRCLAEFLDAARATPTI